MNWNETPEGVAVSVLESTKPSTEPEHKQWRVHVVLNDDVRLEGERTHLSRDLAVDEARRLCAALGLPLFAEEVA